MKKTEESLSISIEQSFWKDGMSHSAIRKAGLIFSISFLSFYPTPLKTCRNSRNSRNKILRTL